MPVLNWIYKKGNEKVDGLLATATNKEFWRLFFKFYEEDDDKQKTQ